VSEYRVQLDVFSGPLDLLLYLVRKEELDIYDIPIARITEQYLHYIEMLKELDMDVAAEFLVMATTLLEIKSAMLLPKSEVEEGPEDTSGDPRSALIHQLLEYKRFKDAANLLSQAGHQRSLRFTRPDSILASLEKTQEPQIDLEQVSVWTLLEAFDRILKATGHVGDFKRIQDDTPIDLYQIEILHRLQTEGPKTLEAVFEGRSNRLVLIGLFLAMLELIRNRLVWAEQADSSSPIVLRALTNVPAEEAVREAILSSQTAAETGGESAESAHEPQEEPQEVRRSASDWEEEMEEEEGVDIEVPEIEIPSPERPRIAIQEIRPPSDLPKPSPETSVGREDKGKGALGEGRL
jgi:segregation and condensation protein A